MQNKEKVKTEYIIKDIACSLRSKREMSKKTYIFMNFGLIAVVLLTVLLIMLNIGLALGLLFLLLILAVLSVMLQPLFTMYKIQKIDLDDYVIKQLTLSNKKHDNYYGYYRTNSFLVDKTRAEGQINPVELYTLVFEKNLEWRIPERLYGWRDDGTFSSAFIYDNANEGEKYIVVINKKTGKIAVAYDTEYFSLNN